MGRQAQFMTFHCLTFKCDLDFQTTRADISNTTLTSQGRQLCQIILRSLHKITNEGPDAHFII